MVLNLLILDFNRDLTKLVFRPKDAFNNLFIQLVLILLILHLNINKLILEIFHQLEKNR